MITVDLERQIARLERTLDRRQNRWIEAAKEALAGDTRALRLMVDLAEAPPVEVALSTPTKDPHHD